MEFPRANLLGLDACRPDHLAPLHGILGNELAKFSGCVRKHDAAQVAEPSLELRIGERLVDFFVELGDDLGGRILRSADAEPRACLVSWHDLPDGRQVRQDFRARRGRHRKRPQLIGPDILNGRGKKAKVGLYLSAEQVEIISLNCCTLTFLLAISDKPRYLRHVSQLW